MGTPQERLKDSFKDAEFIFKLPSTIKQDTLIIAGPPVEKYHWQQQA